MNCEDARSELMDRSPLSDAAQMHIEVCDECRLFRSDLGMIQEALDRPVPTPAAIRERPCTARVMDVSRER